MRTPQHDREGDQPQRDLGQRGPVGLGIVPNGHQDAERAEGQEVEHPEERVAGQGPHVPHVAYRALGQEVGPEPEGAVRLLAPTRPPSIKIVTMTRSTDATGAVPRRGR